MFGIFKSKAALIFLLLIVLIALFLVIRGNTIENIDSQQVAEIAELITPEETEEVIETENEQMTGAEQSGMLYADLMCSIADPDFWNDFFDDWDDQTESERLAEEEKTRLFYESHGYPTEYAGNTDIVIHWGEDEFIKTVEERIAESGDCIVNITNQGILLDDHLNGPPPQN